MKWTNLDVTSPTEIAPGDVLRVTEASGAQHQVTVTDVRLNADGSSHISVEEGVSMQMETATLTLTDFLLARIAEDEAVAQLAADKAKRLGGIDNTGVVPGEDGGRWGDWLEVPTARFLAECEAKRRIVGEHYNGSPETYLNRCSPCDTGDDPCPTLRALALPYWDHLDYSEDWRP